MADNTTTKFKADITDFRKAMQEASRYVKLVNSEFKESTAHLDKWSNSAEGLNKKTSQLNKILDAQKRQLEVLEAEYKRIVAEEGEAGKGAQNLQIRINNQKSSIKETQKEIEHWEKALSDLNKTQEKAEQPINKLNSEIEEQEKNLKSLKEQYKSAVFEKQADKASELSKNISEVSKDLALNKAKMNELDAAADKLDESIESTSDVFTIMKGALANLVADGIELALSAMKDMIADTLDVGKAFESTMSQVKAISGVTGKQFTALKNKAKDMGKTTAFTASEAGEAFEYMAMAGWEAEDMLNGVDGVMNLAAASGTDLATASDIVTDALTAMGYGAKDATKLADVMAAASSNANTNVEMMGDTFKYVAPLIGALGYNMEDTAVAVGLMANAGIKADKAGTALRSTLSRLSAPPAECANAMEDLGISMTDEQGNMKSLGEVMDDLRSAFDGLSETQQTQYAKQIAGQEAMSGLLAIVNAAPSDYERLTNAINNADGAAEKMSATMRDNLGGDMTLLSSKMESIQIALYEKIEPALRSGVEALSGLANGLGFVVDHLEVFSAVISGLTVTVATFLLIMNWGTIMAAATKAIKGVQLAMVAFNTALATNPIALIVALVAGLIAAFITLWNTSEEFRNFWIGLWDGLKEKVMVVVDWIKENWQTMLLFLINPLAGIFQYCYEHFEGFRDFVDTTIQSIKSFFDNMWEGLKDIFSNVAEWINTNVFEPIMAFFEPVIDFYRTAFEIIFQLAQGCWELIKLVWQLVSAWFNAEVVEPLKKGFVGLWNIIKNSASNAWNFIKTVWQVVSSWFKGTIITPVNNYFTNMWNKLKSGASAAWSAIKNVFGSVSTWFETKFRDAWTKVKNVFSTGGKIFDGIKEGITSAFKTIVNGIINGINKVISTPFNAINNALDKIRNVSFMGISPFKDLLSRFDVPKIPTLAKGGIIKGARHIIAGEDGAEAIVPLEKNKGWLKVIANELREQIDKTGFNVKAHIFKENDASGISNNSNSQIINFTQNIHSPKAMDRLSVYRDTNNLLFSAKVRLRNV